MLLGIITSLVPLLVSQAEKLFPGDKQGTAKHVWVMGFVQDLFEAIVAHVSVPSWLLPEKDLIEKLASEALETAVSKIDP